MGEEEYKVEEIIDVRKWHNQKQYLIKWKGYTENDNSWEPKMNVEHAQEMIVDLYNKHPEFDWATPRRKKLPDSSSKLCGEF
jgi:hypothetical protein